MKIYTPSRNIALFLIITLEVIALIYNSSFNVIENLPYHQIAQAIPNLQANNNISKAGPNGTNTNAAPSVNHPPVVKVGPDQTVNENATVMLVGFAIDPDPDDKVSYSWLQIAGPAITLNGANTDTPSFTAPSNLPSDTPLKFTLTAKDDKGAESANPATVTITVKHMNHPPIADANQDQTVNPGYVVSLDGTASKDPDGDPITYSWIQTAGPNVTINGADKPIATFTAPKDISSDTDMLFELSVTDDKGATNIATAKVTVKYIPPPNQPPIANNVAVRIDGNRAVDILLTASDTDKDPLIFTIESTPSSGVLSEFDSATGKVTYTPEQDFTGTDNFTFKVNDGKADSNKATVSITVNPIVKGISNQTTETATEQNKISSQSQKQIKEIALIISSTTTNPGSEEKKKNTEIIEQIIEQIALQTAQVGGNADQVINQIAQEVFIVPQGYLAYSIQHLEELYAKGNTEEVSQAAAQIGTRIAQGQDITQTFVQISNSTSY